MNREASGSETVVVCERHGERASMVYEFLRAEGLDDAAWNEPNELRGLVKAIDEGNVRCVILPDIASLLTALWDQQIPPALWLERGIRIRFASSDSDDQHARKAIEAWRSWDRRHQRRQVVAGVILSIVVLLGGFLLLLCSA